MTIAARSLFLSMGALALATLGCTTSQDSQTAQRQSGQGSCQLVESGYGPTGSDPVHFESVVSSLKTPWSLAFLPGGDILVTERPGRVRLVQSGNLIEQPVARINVTEIGEGGLLGIVLHPLFTTNSLFYLYETVTKNRSLVNRIERYRLSADHRSAALDRIILDDIPGGRLHDGGRMRFGPDGMLYVSTGNAGITDLSQDANSLSGKVLRLTADGAIPADNPQPGKAWFLNGVRNSQGFDWLDPQTLVIADHGPTGEYQGRMGGDEVSLAHAGDNLGWPTIWHCETQAGLLTPVLSWIAAVPPGGLTIYRGNSIPGWNGNVILGTLASQHLHRIILDSNGTVSRHEVYLEGQGGRLRDVTTSPDGDLYVTTSNCDGRGQCPPQGDSILKVVPGSSAARSPQALSGTQNISVQGRMSFGTGNPLSERSVTLKVTAGGSHLFDDSVNSCRGDPHMQAAGTSDIFTDVRGDFASALILSDFTSRVNSSCSMQKGLEDLDLLTVNASIDTDSSNCSEYCRATSNSDTPECVSTCLTGQRKLEALKTFSRAELSPNLSLPLIFNELGPPLSTGRGPDLVVNQQAAQSTVQISTETFGPNDCAVIEGCLLGTGQRKLLRFDGVIQNLGDADFVLGSPQNNPIFTYSACHDHYHLQDIMLYELLDPATKKPVTVGGTEIVGRKQGFCMIDNDQVAGEATGKYDCDIQGLSPGWSDNYDHTLDCQWLDVTGVPAGNYLLRITANPSGRYAESNHSNNSAEVPVTIR